MSKEQFEVAQLITKYLQGTLDAEEQQKLQELANQDFRIKQLLQGYRDTSILREDLDFMKRVDMEDDWEAVLKKYQQPHKKQSGKVNWWKRLSIAAILLLLCSIFWWQFSGSNQKGVVPDQHYGYKNDVLPGASRAVLTLSSGKKVALGNDSVHLTEDAVKMKVGTDMVDYTTNLYVDTVTAFNSISVPRGGTYSIKLQDGTKVWLNAATKLEFPVNFSKSERSVKLLSGEAYFEVSQIAKVPFLVHTSETIVEALGTAFNINSYTSHQVKTILTEGKIRVSNGAKKTTVQPGYAVLSSPESLLVEQVNVEEALSWKDGYFYFDGKDLSQILDEVSRWYDVKIQYETNVSKKKYRGGIKRSVTLASVCNVLCDLSGKKFTIDGRTLIVKKN